MERIHSGPMAGRDRERTDDAAREIRAAGSGQVDVFVADVSSQSEVRRLADEVLHSLPRIDVLINNVGGYWNTRHVTSDELERTFALNHLAPYLLTDLLLDRLKQSTAARGFRSRPGAGDRPLLRSQHAQEILQAQLRRSHRVTTLAGERRAGRPDRYASRMRYLTPASTPSLR